MKAVLDTNVFISSIFWGGTPRSVVNLANTHHFYSVTSIEILQELQVVLLDDFNVSESKTKDIIIDILSYSQLVEIKPYNIKIRDPKDAKIIDCALSSKANFIVSGDKDLLHLNKVKDTRIITPADFLKVVKSL